VSTDHDVVIVGAGPVGLTLAGELEVAGVHAVIVERLVGPDPRQKARGVGVLASEALRRRGLGTRLQTHHDGGRSDFRHDMGSEKGHFAWIAKLDHRTGTEHARTPALIWQPDLERLLTDYAIGLGAELHRDHHVTGLRQDDERVHVTLQTPSGTREFTAAYVIGCDGGRSTVRTLAGFAFPGLDATQLDRVARIRPTDPDDFPAPTKNTRGALQHGGLRDGWIRVRLSERLTPDDDTIDVTDRSPVTVDEIRDALRRITEVDVLIDDIAEARRASDASRQAATYRLGRILLAGDAAHVHSPMGGQGLNLGIMDAVNLGWKLAAVLNDRVDDLLLDTYTRERHPVGKGVIDNTRAQSALLAPTPHTEALRAIFSTLMDISAVNDHLSAMLDGTGVRYTLPYDVGTDHDLLGGHLPDFVVDDTTLYTLVRHGQPLLLHTASTASAVATARPWTDRIRVRSALVTGRPDLSAALVRPDGVLAWAATPSHDPDHAALTKALHTWCGAARYGT
jgi:2-polyprenyl-6-methoxyphenol hydroxylase-like FAD-dependent oxidoreductase